MSEPCDRILVLGVQLRSDMTTLANVTAKIRKNNGSATTYTSASSPAITRNVDINYGYELQIPASTYADGDRIEVAWLYDSGSGATPYAYDTYSIGAASVDGAHYTNARGDNLANLDATVSSVASAVAAIPASIWNALTSGLTAVGSIGKLLTTNVDAAISTRSTYDGTDTSGTTTLLGRLTSTRAGYIDQIPGIAATTDLLGTGVITYGGPVLASDRIELVQGDDYLTADGRALTWTSADWPTLTSSTVSLGFRKTTKPHATTSYPGSVTSASAVAIQLTSAQTGELDEGTWSFALKTLLSNSHEITLAEGTALVVEFP